MPHRANSFHALRLLAATMVIHAHAFVLSGSGPDPVSAYTGGASSGAVAVWMFFVISGWLVTASYASDPHLARFTARRLLRIFPALALTVVATALLLGPMVTTLPAADYFRHPSTPAYLGNVFLVRLQDLLPGVFAANPFPNAVNGSLWTLQPELLCYIGIAGLGACALLRAEAVAAALLVSIASQQAMLAYADTTHWAVLLKVRLMLEFMVFFLSGSLAWLLRDAIRFHWIAVPVLFAALCALGPAGYGQLVLFALLPYATLSVALLDTGTSSFFERIGDWSYGTYLWAFPIQQSLMAWDARMPLPLFMLSSVILSWLAGALSWHLVERRALAFKPARRAR
ncbi:MAG TPA: acyltransferase [Usitatibacter sp.]|nr:acyltransferase [Usitatibacter sp.]